ncbi:putative caspase [Xylariomycetidae sp. FL0641]|nr:putative caspase [Xylariomycetidae sp. FL0641]
MESEHTVAKHYGVLIGIDAYPEKPLKACVRDIETLERFLKGKLSSFDCQKLVARRRCDVAADMPPEDPEQWPSLHNVTSALENVTSRGHSGDFVYIHFSGHGTRLAPKFDFSNYSSGDLALLLLEGESSREKFLRGPRLAGLLKNMAAKGLLVTLVLDCCFSASVYRSHEPDLRYFPDVSEASPRCSTETSDRPATRKTPSGMRDADMRDSWLLNPDHYTILAACGPHENAKGGYETELNGEHYGALSYFLHQALSAYGLEHTHKDIHRHLCARFRQSQILQHPVLYGNAGRGFFGQVNQNTNRRRIGVVNLESGLYLMAGQAHGFQDGDRVNLQPLDRPQAEAGSIAEITDAGPLTSTLKPQSEESIVGAGWMGEPLEHSLVTRCGIRVDTTIPQYDKLLEVLQPRCLGSKYAADSSPLLQVTLSSEDEYVILDSSGERFANLPSMLRRETDADRVANVLDRVARFTMVKGLVNNRLSALFQDSFHVNIESDGKTYGPEERLEVRYKGIVKLSLQNVGEQVIYLHAYGLGPLWQIEGLLRGTYEAVLPRKVSADGNVEQQGRASRRVKMTVPLSLQGRGFCEDVIKVLVTSQPTTFDLFEQARVDELGKISSGGRTGSQLVNVEEDWTAVNFYIRTTI